MTQTTIIAGLGLSVFALSTFTPTQRFGTLMLALLVAALVGDLIFLPALLASPFGRLFAVKPHKKPQEDSERTADKNEVLDESLAIAPFEGSDADQSIQVVARPLGSDRGEPEKKVRREDSIPISVQRPKMMRQDDPHVRRKS